MNLNPTMKHRTAAGAGASPAARIGGAVAPLLFVVALAGSSLARAAEPPTPQKSMRPPAALAYETALNIGIISDQLAKNQLQVAAMIAERTTAIAAREREAAQALRQVDDEIEVYRMSRGGAVADRLVALIRSGDRTALGPSELDAMEAALRADVAASAALPQMSNEKLDAAAKKLAALAEEPSALERAKEVLGFVKATKKAVDKLEEKAAADKQNADDAIKTATTSTAKGTMP